MPSPYAIAIKHVLLAGGVVDGFVTGKPGNARCNGQEVRCLFKVRGPEREVRVEEAVIRNILRRHVNL